MGSANAGLCGCWIVQLQDCARGMKSEDSEFGAEGQRFESATHRYQRG